MNKPDFTKLRAVNAELDELARSGRVTKGDWDRLRAEAAASVAGQTELLEGFLTQGLELGFVTSG